MTPNDRGFAMGSDVVEKLKAQGWIERFTASGDRLREATENYRSLGFAVKTVPVREMTGDECSVCFEDENDATMLILTRPASSPKDDKSNEDT